MKKIDMWLKKDERSKTKTEQYLKEFEQAMKEIYEKGVKDGSGTSDVNPFKIKKEEVFIDPNDPNRSPEEQKRLRKNWYHRRSYRRRKKKEKEKAAAIEIVRSLIDAKEKRDKKRAKQKQKDQVDPIQTQTENY